MALKVHVWSDVACPWCYIGKKRLAKAAESMGLDLELYWHSFELDPRPVTDAQKKADYVEFLANKYGRSRSQAQGMIDNMTQLGLEDGVPFDFESAIFANTFDAHRLLQWAAAEVPHKQDPLAAALFDAHLCEGEDLNDTSTLVSIAGRVGLDVDQASSVLASDAYVAEVRADEEQARELGVSGVPFYVIGTYAVGGAQRPETFERVLAQAIADAKPPLDRSAEEGAYCGPEGC